MNVLVEFVVLAVDDADLAGRIGAAMERDPEAARAATILLRGDPRIGYWTTPALLVRDGELATFSAGSDAETVSLGATASVLGRDRVAVDVHLAVAADDTRVDDVARAVVAAGEYARLDVPGLLVFVRPTPIADGQAMDAMRSAGDAERDLVGAAGAKGRRARRRIAEDLLAGAG